MPMYAVYETQRKMDIDDYDEIVTVMDTDISMADMMVQKEDGAWELVEE